MWPLSDDQLHGVLAHLPVVIYQDSHEPRPRTLYLSPNADLILGSGADEHLDDPELWWRSIEPDDHDRLMRAWTEAYEAERDYTVDYRYHRPDGQTVWLREVASPARDVTGQITHWQGVLLDVTRERAAVDELALSDERYRSLVEKLPVVVYADARGEDDGTYVSPNVEEMLGYPASAFIEDGWLWNRSLHPDDVEHVLPRWQDAWLRGVPYDDLEYRLIHADGHTVWVRDRAYVTRDERGALVWHGVLVDTTAQRVAEEARHDATDRYERLLRQIPGIAFSLLPSAPPTFDYLSPRVQDLLGHPHSRWFDETGWWLEAIHPDDRGTVATEWERCTRDEVPFRMEYRMLHAEGHIVWIRAETQPVRGADGEIERWQGLWLDITEAKQAREEQARSEARYQRLVEQTPAIVFTTDPRGAVQYVGPQVEEILGFPHQMWIDEPLVWETLLHPDDRDGVIEAWDEATGAGRPFEAEYRLRRIDGSYRWVREHTNPVRGSDGTVTSWQGLTVDVHELHLANEAREAAEAQARALLENVPAVVYEMGPDDERRTLYVSPHIERLLGYSRAEWLDQPDIWIELLHPDDRETELAAHDQHSSTGEPWSREYRMIAADGQTVWVRDQATLVLGAEGQPSWQGVLVDVTSQHVTAELLQITNEELERRVRERTAALEEANELMGLEVAERRRAETELRQAEARFRELVEQSPALVYAWQTRPGPHGEFDGYVSPQIETLLGYTPDEWHDAWHVWEARLHPHDRERIVAAATRSEESGEPFEEEYRYLAKDGRIVWVFDRATLLERDVDGRPFMFQGVMVDITAQKDAERKAAEAERRFRDVAEDGPFVTYAFTVEPADPSTPSVEFVSPQIAALVGYPHEGWIEDPLRWFDDMHPDDRDRTSAQMHTTWRSGVPWSLEYRMITADGRIVWLRDQGRCIERDGLGRPSRFVGAIADVTDEVEDRQRIREELDTLRRIVEGLPAITWVEAVDTVTGASRHLYISPHAAEVLGYTPEELLAEQGRFVWLVHPDDRDRIERAERRADLPGPGVWDERYRARRRDGEYRWLRSIGRRVSGPDADTAVWVGMAIDVNDDMASEAAAQRGDATRA